jgi:hypothetical protein
VRAVAPDRLASVAAAPDVTGRWTRRLTAVLAA